MKSVTRHPPPTPAVVITRREEEGDKLCLGGAKALMTIPVLSSAL